MKDVAPLKIRGIDCFGSGAYLASRGNRLHSGIDIEVHANESVISYTSGTVTHIGYPYNPNHPQKGKYRYIEITSGNHRLRYMYVGVLVELGDDIRRGQTVGWSQDLDCTYSGITQHTHFDVKDGSGQFIDPEEYLKDIGYVVECS